MALEQHAAECSPLELATTLAVLATASVSLQIFPVAAAGYSTMEMLALYFLLPAIGLLALCILLGMLAGWRRLYQDTLGGMWIGALATIGLEVVRIIGFRVFDAMPGSLPMLAGVLLTNQFMQGPTLLSDAVGWAYHFWNGACFGIIYLLVLGRRSWWIGVIYGLVIAVVFMSSPVVVMTGAGYFGSGVGPGFAATVLAAHCVFGGTMGWLASREQIERSALLVCLVGSAAKLVEKWKRHHDPAS